MQIQLSPQVSNDALGVVRSGDTLTINGREYDFSVIPDGATLPASAVDCEYVVGDVERKNGALNITLLLPLGPHASEAACFPAPIIDPPDGLLELPK